MTSNNQFPGKTAQAGAALALMILSSPAWAYLDPGTGSMIISAIVGLFATVGLAVKTYWYKLKGFFRRDQSMRERRADAQTQPAVDRPIDGRIEQGTEPERSTES